MAELFTTFLELIRVLSTLVVQLLALAVLQYALLLVWLAWALLGINWQKMWPTLAAGAWAPFVLLIVGSALVWSQLDPVPCNCIGITIPNFWWQLGEVSLLAGATLFCGWLQGVFGWTPPVVEFDPPEAAHDHGHH